MHAGLMVTQPNWLEVYPYSTWGSAQQLPHVQRGQTFTPSSLLLKDVRPDVIHRFFGFVDGFTDPED